MYKTLCAAFIWLPWDVCNVKSMDDNCGEWVECTGVASGCGEQKVGVASGSGWNLWVWLVGVAVRRFRVNNIIDIVCDVIRSY